MPRTAHLASAEYRCRAEKVKQLEEWCPGYAGRALLIACTLTVQSRSSAICPGRAMTRHPVRYFAYDSNMLTARLRERVPSATAIGIGQLEGHVLRWDKRSWRDKSGKCDAEFTGQRSDVVWGVIFELNPEQKPALDQAEGLGDGYIEKVVNILTEAGLITAVTYLATDKDASLRPYHWYKALVIAGAREHGLPPSYRSRLELVITVSDPDPTRASIHNALDTRATPR